MSNDMRNDADRTISDFGEQWGRYTSNDGYYASLELFTDICGPLLPLEKISGARVADIGSGTGRIVCMLLEAGTSRVIAVEPSDAFDVLKENTAEYADRIEYIKDKGEALPRDRNLDYVFSIGVLHHIPDPGVVVKAALEALRPGGRMLVWLYGQEGNEAYLRFAKPLRAITTHLPAPMLAGVSHLLNAVLGVYIVLCRFLPLPMHSYINNVLAKFSWRKRFLVIYDQLNPKVAKYYTKAEAAELLEKGGFHDVRLHHRHGYSWTVIGTRPDM